MWVLEIQFPGRVQQLLFNDFAPATMAYQALATRLHGHVSPVRFETAYGPVAVWLDRMEFVQLVDLPVLRALQRRSADEAEQEASRAERFITPDLHS